MDCYEVVCEIGKGSFGSVHKIRRVCDNKILVWKELNYGKMTEKEKQQLVAEVNILRELRHPNIVRYYDRIIDKVRAKIYIVMEYCENGDMKQLLRKCRKDKDHISEEVIWKVFMQIVLALYECHHRKEGKIIHRDLKPGNVFFDAKNNVKLGDFGLARVLDKGSQYAYSHVGTPYYMSPEQINDSKYNEKTDIWSAGCVLYEMAALRPPFEAENQFSLATKIRAGNFNKLSEKYSEELSRVIRWMLSIRPEERPSIDNLLNVPQISLRIREKRFRENQKVLQKKKEEYEKKELQVIARESALKKLEDVIKSKKEQLKVIEKRINELKLNISKTSHMKSSISSSDLESLPNQKYSTVSEGVKQIFSDNKKHSIESILK
jgi:NIMA (never in mitosis gene a)-related kinase